MIDKNELRKAKYEYDEMREALPEELNNALDKCFDLLQPFVCYIEPARDELKVVLQKLRRKQFPELSITGNPFLLQCIDDIINLVSDMLATGVQCELSKIENGVNIEVDDDQFQRFVELYAQPHNPKIKTLEDYKDFTGFSYVDKVEFVNEVNEDSIAICNEFNSSKSEFTEVVQPILFKYFGERLNELDAAGWERYAIEVGFAFVSYSEDFYSLIYYLENGLIVGNPGMNFFEFKVQTNT